MEDAASVSNIASAQVGGLSNSWLASFDFMTLVYIILGLIALFIVFRVIVFIVRRVRRQGEVNSLQKDLMVRRVLSKLSRGGNASDNAKSELNLKLALIDLAFKQGQEFINKQKHLGNKKAWFIVLGEPACGKTKLLEQSNLGLQSAHASSQTTFVKSSSAPNVSKASKASNASTAVGSTALGSTNSASSPSTMSAPNFVAPAGDNSSLGRAASVSQGASFHSTVPGQDGSSRQASSSGKVSLSGPAVLPVAGSSSVGSAAEGTGAEVGDLSESALGNVSRPDAVSPAVQFYVGHSQVMLDVSGQVFFDHWAGGSSAEYTHICQLINHNHHSEPLRGIVLCIPADALLADDSKLTQKKALLMLEELWRLTSTVNQYLPCYIIITKLDVVLGFREYFASQSEEFKDQALGMLTPLEIEPFFNQLQAKLQAGAFALFTSKEVCDLTYQGKSRLEKSAGIYLFPQNFAKLQNNLFLYLNTIFAPQSKNFAFFRGLFLTSAQDDGYCLDSDFAQLAHMAMDDAPFIDINYRSSRSYFIKGALTCVFKDPACNHFNHKAQVQRDIPRYFAVAACSALIAFFLHGVLFAAPHLKQVLATEVLYYRGLNQLFSTQVIDQAPLLATDSSGHGFTLFDMPMPHDSTLSRLSFFSENQSHMQHAFSLPISLLPGALCSFNFDFGADQAERGFIYNQLQTRMVYLPLVRGLEHSFILNRQALTTQSRNALFALMAIALYRDLNTDRQFNDSYVPDQAQAMLSYLYPNLTNNTRHELLYFLPQYDWYSNATNDAIVLDANYAQACRLGLGDLIKHWQDLSNYPDSEYQQIKIDIKAATRLNAAYQQLLSMSKQDVRSLLKAQESANALSIDNYQALLALNLKNQQLIQSILDDARELDHLISLLWSEYQQQQLKNAQAAAPKHSGLGILSKASKAVANSGVAYSTQVPTNFKGGIGSSYTNVAVSGVNAQAYSNLSAGTGISAKKGTQTKNDTDGAGAMGEAYASAEPGHDAKVQGQPKLQSVVQTIMIDQAYVDLLGRLRYDFAFLDYFDTTRKQSLQQHSSIYFGDIDFAYLMRQKPGIEQALNAEYQALKSEYIALQNSPLYSPSMVMPKANTAKSANGAQAKSKLNIPNPGLSPAKLIPGLSQAETQSTAQINLITAQDKTELNALNAVVLATTSVQSQCAAQAQSAILAQCAAQADTQTTARSEAQAQGDAKTQAYALSSSETQSQGVADVALVHGATDTTQGEQTANESDGWEFELPSFSLISSAYASEAPQVSDTAVQAGSTGSTDSDVFTGYDVSTGSGGYSGMGFEGSTGAKMAANTAEHEVSELMQNYRLNYLLLSDFLSLCQLPTELQDFEHKIAQSETLEQTFENFIQQRTILERQQNKLEVFIARHADNPFVQSLAPMGHRILNLNQQAFTIASYDKLLSFYPQGNSATEIMGQLSSKLAQLPFGLNSSQPIYTFEYDEVLSSNLRLRREYNPGPFISYLKPLSYIKHWLELNTTSVDSTLDPSQATQGTTNDSAGSGHSTGMDGADLDRGAGGADGVGSADGAGGQLVLATPSGDVVLGEDVLLVYQHIQHNQQLAMLQTVFSSYAGALIDYYAKMADNVAPRLNSYEGFHELSLNSRAYEINDKLHSLYELSFKTIAALPDDLLNPQDVAAKKQALEHLQQRLSEFSVNLNDNCASSLNTWSLLPADALSASALIEASPELSQQLFTMSNSLPWWQSFEAQGHKLLQNAAVEQGTLTVETLMDRLNAFPTAKDGAPEQALDLTELNSLYAAFKFLGLKPQNDPLAALQGDAGRSSTGLDGMSGAAKQLPGLIKSPSVKQQIIKSSALSAHFLTNLEQVLSVLCAKRQMGFELFVPNAAKQNQLYKHMSFNLPLATLTYRYISAQGEGIMQEGMRISSAQSQNRKLFSGLVFDQALTLSFYEFSSDVKPQAQFKLYHYPALQMYLNPSTLYDEKARQAYVPLTIKSKKGSFVYFIGLQFDKDIPSPDNWPSSVDFKML